MTTQERIGYADIIDHHLKAVNVPLWVEYGSHVSCPYINLDSGKVLIPEHYTKLYESGELEFALGHEVGHIVECPKSLETAAKITTMLTVKFGPSWSQKQYASVENFLADPMATLHGLRHAVDPVSTASAIKRFYNGRQFAVPQGTTIENIPPLAFIKMMTMEATKMFKSGKKPKFKSIQFEQVFTEMFITPAPLLERMENIISIMSKTIRGWLTAMGKNEKKYIRQHQKPGPSSRPGLPMTDITGEGDNDKDQPGKGASESISSFLQRNKKNIHAPLRALCQSISLDMLIKAVDNTDDYNDCAAPSNERRIWRTEDRVSELDIGATLKKYGAIIPGVTTVRKPMEEVGEKEGNKAGTVYLLLDISGSMHSYMGPMMIVAMGAVFGAKNAGHKVAISTFNDYVIHQTEPSKDYEQALTTIEKLTATGGTRSGSAARAVREKIQQNDPDATLLIVTDGAFGSTEAKLLAEYNPITVLVGGARQYCLKALQSYGMTNVAAADTMNDLSGLFAQFAGFKQGEN